MRKIKKVTLLKDMGLPGNAAEAGTVAEIIVKDRIYWRFYNGDDYYSYSENDLKKYPDYFKIEYETPKIKSVAVKLERINDRTFGFGTEFVGYYENIHIEEIEKNPEKFIIEYEEDSE